MAFGRDDTDELYDKAILPVLKRNNVSAIRVDRRQDNRDINLQIIEMLENCDFCIADLTYARPSVYFEAGYAQRGVEVIYTVRSDHLRRKQDENLRVHFDVQMKPLITWKNPSDTTFPARLDRRLKNTVLKKLERKGKLEEKTEKEKRQFTSLPISERLALIRRHCVLRLRRAGYNSWYTCIGGFFSYFSPPQKIKSLPTAASFNNTLVSKRLSSRMLQVVSVTAQESFHLKTLREVNGKLVRDLSYHLERLMDPSCRRIKSVAEHHIFCSVRKVPSSRIMSAMPQVARHREESAYRFDSIVDVNKLIHRHDRHARSSRTISTKVHFYFLSPIECKTDLDKKMNAVIGEIKGGNRKPRPRSEAKRG